MIKEWECMRVNVKGMHVLMTRLVGGNLKMA